ncbi:MAG: PAS domain-containing protein [Sphingomonas phyllosphaerae]
MSLTPELETFVTDSLATGDYGNASEVVRTALKLLRDGPSPRETPGIWPVGGGECGALIRSADWTRHALGPVERWSPALRVTVANVVNSPVPKVLMWGGDGVLLYNDAYREILGARHPGGMGETAAAVFPEIADWNRAIIDRGLAGEVVSYRDQPLTLIRESGPTELFFDLFYTPVIESDGKPGGVLCTVIDNTARLLLERRLAASEGELRMVTDALPLLVSFIDRDLVYRYANQHYYEWFGIGPDDVIGRHTRDVIGAENFERRRPFMERALAGETIVEDSLIQHGDGSWRRADIRYLPRIDERGEVLGFQVIVLDVEERVRREEALNASNARFRAAMEAMHGVLWTNDAEGRMVGEQIGWAMLTGQTPEQYQGYGWADAVHPDDAQASVTAWRKAVESKSTFVFEHRVRRHCGTWRTFAVRAVPRIDARGEVAEWVGVHTDITHQRAAEAALRDHAEQLERQVRHRERAEEQLRQLNETLETRVIEEIASRHAAERKLAQAQKMETVGKLTGGVAHDFNNLLQVVSGNLQLLQKDIAGNDRAETRVANALAGVSRGSRLAAQLLAFGRRQALEPKVVNVTRFVRGMDDMLRRAIGEGIEVETIFGGGLWNTFIDPGQIENALLNLAINARDAMDGQGKLTIELANAHLDDDYARRHDEVEPGQYVMLAVTDTGCGMSDEVVAKVFEPFFSTKAEGKGSGLGLSMVYGFVKQSGGHVNIYSEPGHGSTIRLYLPRAMEREDVEVVLDSGPIAGGTETVLVVEDDDEVRATVVEMLGDLGYRVLKAVDAQSALSVVESGIPIDLLFTDVVMPGTLKSPEMARKARERLPDLAVLFTSGYTENSIVHGGRLDAGVELLSKPYTREALARKIRHVLAQQAQRRESVAPRPPVTPPLAETMAARRTILLVEDDMLIRSATAEVLQEAGHVVVDAASAEEAMAALQTAPIDALVTDVHLPGTSGLELAGRAAELHPGIRIVVASGDIGAVTAEEPNMHLLAKPYSARELLALLGEQVARERAREGEG